MSLTSAALSKRYPNQSEKPQMILRKLTEVCAKYIADGFGDHDALQKLSSDDTNIYWQQLSEVLLANQLLNSGIQISHPAEGPDFLIEMNGKKTWIEVITPEPSGLPDEWLNPTEMGFSMPHEAILLRWTAAIKEKAEKLQGYTCRRSGRTIEGYLDKGIVAATDSYIIAINGRLLRRSPGVFPELTGISQFPFAVEATFCVGPMQINIDRTTLKTTSIAHQNRSLISKPVGEPVPADTFIDPRFAAISAIWAVDIDELSVIGEERPMVVIHNPHASNPISKHFLPARSEYIAIEKDDHYQLDRHDGSLTLVAA